jgi:hypothetical protein
MPGPRRARAPGPPGPSPPLLQARQREPRPTEILQKASQQSDDKSEGDQATLLRGGQQARGQIGQPDREHPERQDERWGDQRCSPPATETPAPLPRPDVAHAAASTAEGGQSQARHTRAQQHGEKHERAAARVVGTYAGDAGWRDEKERRGPGDQERQPEVDHQRMSTEDKTYWVSHVEPPHAEANRAPKCRRECKRTQLAM